MLYHGSKIGDLKILQPSPSNLINGEGVVFATPDIRFALSMIYGTSNELDIGYIIDQKNKKEEMYIKELIPNAFNLLSKPGYIYTVSDKKFISDSRLSHIELISKTATPIISEKYIPNILNELQKGNIKFISKNTQQNK